MAELVQDSSGRWVLRGTLPADAAPIPVAAPKPPALVKAPATQPKPKGFWGQLMNDLQYEVNATFGGGTAGLKRAGKNLVTYPGRLWLLQQSAIAEIQRNGIEAVQSLMGQRGDYATTRWGAAVDRNEENLYRRFGLTPPSQQQGIEALLTGFGTEAVAQVGMAAVGGAALGRAAQVAPFLRPVQSALNPAAGKTILGKTGRFVAGAVASEAATTPFVNNTGGSAVSLVNMVLGTNLPDPVTPEMNRIESMRAGLVPNTAFSLLAGGALLGGASAIGRFRRSTSTSRRQRAARGRLQQQGVVVTDPDTGAAGFADPGKRPTWKDVEKELGIEPEPDAPAAPELPPPEDAGVEGFNRVQPGELPTANPADDPWRTPSQRVGTEPEWSPVQEALMPEPPGGDEAAYSRWLQSRGASNAIVPLTADPAPNIPPWTIPYDPALPEADTLLRTIDETLDADEIAELAQGKGPVVERIEELVINRQMPEVNPDRTFENSAAPVNSVSKAYLDNYRDALESLDAAVLRDLAANSPEVSIKTTEVTGKAPEEFTKSDVIEGLLAIPDQAVLVNRVGGKQLSPMLRVDEMEVDPDRFQFKGNTDEAGVQAGNSLEGVDRWNPDAEGIIQVWTDPANGRTYVVNGHNRLAKAKALGIPTMRVVYLNARTAEQARAMGAMANIAEGGGTAFDAAKFLRESDITSTKQLKELGANLSDQRNLWVPGLALSRLPEDAFLMAVNGTLDLNDAVMLGKSGLSPETMSEIAKVALRRGWTGPKLAEMLAQGEATKAVAGKADQVDLFGNAEVVNKQELKADLAIRVEQLIRTDRNAFRSAGRNADLLKKGGNVIDKSASGEIADESAQALKFFTKLKYEAGPISDLLNEGVEELAKGAQLEPIAARVAREMPATIEIVMSGGKKKPKASRQAPAEKAEFDPETQGVLDELEGLAADLGESASRNAESARRMAESAAGIEDAIDGTPTRDQVVPGPRSKQPDPESLEALEGEIDRAVRQQQEWEKLPQVKRDARADEARKLLLTDRKRATREAKAAELKEREAKALKWLEDDTAVLQGRMSVEDYEAKWGEGSYKAEEPPVKAPTKADYRPVNELEKDQWARNYLAWYDAQPRKQLQGAQLEKAKAAVVSRAVDAGEVRPPATPIPDELPVADPNLQAAADELARNELGPNVQEVVGTELALRDAYEAQDLTVRMLDGQEERVASGFDFKPLEEVRAEVVETFVDPEPVPMRPTKAGTEAPLQPVVGIDELLEQSRVSIKVTKAEAEYLRTVFINPDEFSEMPLRDAEAMLVTIPDEPGAPRRLRKKLQAQVDEAAMAAADQALAAMPEAPPAAGGSIADAFAQVAREMARSDARLFRKVGQTLDVANRAVDALEDVVNPPIDVQVKQVRDALPAGKAGKEARRKLAQAQADARRAEAPPIEFALPAELSKSAPRYGMASLAFESDLDKAAYILHSDKLKGRQSKAAPKFRAALEAAGIDPDELAAKRGPVVKEAIKDAVTDQTGSARAPQSAIKIQVPASDRAFADKLRDTAAEVADEQVTAISAEIEATKRRAMEEGC